jgi:signal transduction histidine kinase
VRINSGLGAATPLNIIVLPVLFEGAVRAVVELASFSPFSATHQMFLDQLPESIGLVLNTIEGDTLTENLLKQSQSQAEELRTQQEELRESNEDLGRQTKLLAEQNIQAESKNEEIETSKREADQLAVSSKYKSEFIANMSHEIRTPLNSLLILAEQLADNPDQNMTATQVEYASVILASGRDLLDLLNSILDLAKVESGTALIETVETPVEQIRSGLLREFGPVARAKGLEFSIDLAPGAPADIVTDPQRLSQILKNLLANAFKFTDSGQVELTIDSARTGWSPETTSLAVARSVVAFTVRDTGIGIEKEQQQLMFEAFAQADGSPRAAMAGQGSACPSAAVWSDCWTARSPWRAGPETEAPSRSTFPWAAWQPPRLDDRHNRGPTPRTARRPRERRRRTPARPMTQARSGPSEEPAAWTSIISPGAGFSW